MTNVQFRLAGDVVYFITGTGFHKGFVKTAMIRSDKKGQYKIEYRVLEEGEEKSAFQGYEKQPSELWDKWDEMIRYFAKKKK